MAVPDFQSFFKPLLEIASDGKEHSMKEARELIAQKMSLSEEDMKELLPSGTQTKYDNRIAGQKAILFRPKFLKPRAEHIFVLQLADLNYSRKGAIVSM